MRVITGKGNIIRAYIEQIIDKSNYIIFPENGLDVSEQANFIGSLDPNFSGDIITLSSLIISDVPSENMFVLSKDFELEEPACNTYGTSISKINSYVFDYKSSIGQSVKAKLKELAKHISNQTEIGKNVSFEEINLKFGESIERHLLLKNWFDFFDSNKEK